MSRDVELVLIDKYSDFTALIDEDENIIFKSGLEISLKHKRWSQTDGTKAAKMFEKMIGQMIKLEK